MITKINSPRVKREAVRQNLCSLVLKSVALAMVQKSGGFAVAANTPCSIL